MKILNPFAKPKIVEMKISIDMQSGQAKLDTGNPPLDSFFVIRVMLSLIMGLCGAIEERTKMIIRPGSDTPEIKLPENGGENGTQSND